MPLQLPELDNKTYDDLIQELVTSIPKYTKEWTNFNPSDPGITILELLAWVSETLIYRTNIIPTQSYLQFLQLIAGSEVYEKTDAAHTKLMEYLAKIKKGEVQPELQSLKAEAQKFLNSPFRAVTGEDFRRLALEATPDVKRAEALPYNDRIEVVIITDYKLLSREDRITDIINKVRSYIEPRRLIGTLVVIKKAIYQVFDLKIVIAAKSHAKSGIIDTNKHEKYQSIGDAQGDTIEDRVAKDIFAYLDIIGGGPEKTGWPYGRNLTVFELYHIIERIETVDYVKSIDEKSAGSWRSLKEIEVAGLLHLRSLEITVEGEPDE